MGEIEGTYRILQTPGTRLGLQKNSGISTLEPGQILSTTPSSSGKIHSSNMRLKVKMLDETTEAVNVELKSEGQELLTKVYTHLNLMETDYFGIEFQRTPPYWTWLEPTKPIDKQVQRPKTKLLRLAVKFFPPDPGQLQEEYTRYLFALQIKRDLAEERLPCSDNTAALIISHLLQSEIGDYDELGDREHLTINRYLPQQETVQEKIIEFHQKHMGQTPAESDFQVLEIARTLEMYGIRYHLASDREGTKINLSVSHMGVLVFQGNTKINTFNWSKIRKLSFKRKRFLIKLHPEVHGPYQDTLEFLLGSRNRCKNFWKICVEYHTFFRMFDQPKPKTKPMIFSRGSSFRYSGRTQKQLVDYVRDSGMRKVPYDRRQSKVRISARTLNTETPKQNLLFSDTLRHPGSAPSFHSLQTFFPTTTDPGQVSNHNLLDPRSPTSRSPTDWSVLVSAAEDSTNKKQTELLGSPVIKSFQGLLVDNPPLTPLILKSPMSLVPPGESPAGHALSPLLSPVLSDVGSIRVDEVDEARRKRYPTDKAYFIAKEILMTERTYLKDLEIITVWFRSAVVKEDAMPEGLMMMLFSNFDPIYEFHRGFLKQIEQRLALWEGRYNAHAKGDYQRIGDIMRDNMCKLKEFTGYMQKHDSVLTELEKATKRLKKLESVYKEFELQKVCYLPLNTFLLKPIKRLMHYKLILSRLCGHYHQEHLDYTDCTDALKEVTTMTSQLQNTLIRLENFQKLTELQRDLVGIENLTVSEREFIREGCLYKLTKKGLQQRMFFLFSDVLLYTSKGVTGTNQFRIHGSLPLHGMLVEESENEWSVPHCITIYSVKKNIVVAASTRLEMEKWMDDLNMAISLAKKSTEKIDQLLESSLLSHSNQLPPHYLFDQGQKQRPNTISHVCWYRNQSLSLTDYLCMIQNQLSGYLLRKFKNSNGWQKLWVVFTNFCLFFYKTHQNDYPLASLPLLGYTVITPTESDSILKDYVFKLQFKSHVYFFRAESEYTFERWMEVIKRATCNRRRNNLLNQPDEKEAHTN
ncbi:FERM, ARHGEF and pleckstrin domain-containing protein 2 isoform X2 [Ambystoma mexicanum]|uniref:FERM, ARHGEF and pleckstrin domain-containing protein 2 isoform X2 n=1 Tax=Ambystoma mexicanum TaxID=8296 RepID=UPI0037E84418